MCHTFKYSELYSCKPTFILAWSDCCIGHVWLLWAASHSEIQCQRLSETYCQKLKYSIVYCTCIVLALLEIVNFVSWSLFTFTLLLLFQVQKLVWESRLNNTSHESAFMTICHLSCETYTTAICSKALKPFTCCLPSVCHLFMIDERPFEQIGSSIQKSF